MSTKTTFKRIALVAVAALGLGVLSVAPSSAAVSNLSVTVTAGTAGLVGAASDSTTGAKIVLTALNDAGNGDTVTVSFVAKAGNPAAVQARLQFIETTTVPTVIDTATVVANTEAATWSNTDSVTAGGIYNVSTLASATNTGAYVGANFRLFIESASSTTRIAGTYGYSVVVKQYSAGIATPVTTTYDANIVIAAAAADSTTPSAAYVSAFLNESTGQTTDTAGISKLATASTSAAAYLPVSINNAANGAAAIDTVTVSVTGPGLIYNGTSYGKSLSASQTGLKEYTIVPDGQAGVATITVKTTISAVTITKSMTFYAKNATTITASVNHPVLAAGDNVGAVKVAAVDSAGNPWTGTAYIYATSAASALIAGSETPVQCAAYTVKDGILCPVTAATVGTASFKVIDASTVATAKATSNEVTLTVKAQTPATVKLAFDKASYAPNEKALITVTPLDAAGGTMQGKTWTALLASGGVSSNVAFASGSQDSLTTGTQWITSKTTSSSSGTTAGSYTFVVYMPAYSGDVTITAKGGTDLPAAGQVTVTATASVVNASVDAATDAANEATDAANAATDAALAAADAADAATAAAQDASDAVAALSATVAKLVASLKAQITSLTNLVIKIQKKVKA